jgi:hypothetical protein
MSALDRGNTRLYAGARMEAIMAHAHSVFFELKDGSPANCAALVKDCYDYLGGHDGLLSISAGTRAPEYVRDVNDLQFHVALHMVFKDRSTHDAYQTAPRHNQFLVRNKDGWKSVRVFDSTIAPVM